MKSRNVIVCIVFILLIVLPFATRENTEIQISIQDENAYFSPSSLDDAYSAAELTSIALNDTFNFLGLSYSRILTQRNIARHLDAVMRSLGADASMSFPTLVISGSELTIPHGNPYDDTSHVVNSDSETSVMIDVGSKFNGHCSDVTRTFFFDSATEEMFDAYQAILNAEEAIISAIQPGVQISTLDEIMLEEIGDYVGTPGVMYLTTWGHRVGQFVHEYPYLGPSFANEVLVEGQVFAIEPGLYFSDGWAVRVEDTVVVTEDGCEILSNVPKQLNDIRITEDASYVDVMFSSDHYEYGSNVNLNLTIQDTTNELVENVQLFDGSQWVNPKFIATDEYTHGFYMNYSYSNVNTWVLRVSFQNRSIFMTAKLRSSVLNYDEWEVNSPPSQTVFAGILTWRFENVSANMISVKFQDIAELDGQLLILDGEGRVIDDFTNTRKDVIWTPWVPGSVLLIGIIPTSSEGLSSQGSSFFNVSRIGCVTEDLIPPIMPTTTTSTTDTVAETNSPSDTETPSSYYSLEVILLFAGMSGLGMTIVLIPALLIRRRMQ